MDETRNHGKHALLVGIASSALFHVVLAILLTAAATSNPVAVTAEEDTTNRASPIRRRAAFGEQALAARRSLEGPYPRLAGYGEVSCPRRKGLIISGRRLAEEESWYPYRNLELSRGRRGVAGTRLHKSRGIDFGSSDETILKAMVIPRLGKKQLEKYRLPRLTKYEQPERIAAGINIRKLNPDHTPIKHKADKHRKAQIDRRSKKPSLSELLDAPDDDDPRRRPTRLDDIVGVATGSVHGTGSVETEGNIYLGKVESAIRRSFAVPVFMSPEDLKKSKVDIEIRQMNAQGQVLSYRLRRSSDSSAFNSAALEAIKRFAPSEGGNKKLPTPPAAMLVLINEKHILIRLDGGKLR